MGRMSMKSTRRVLETICSFARTAHSFACSALLATLARSAALICSLAGSLTRSGAHGTEVYVHELNVSISYLFNPLCRHLLRTGMVVLLRALEFEMVTNVNARPYMWD